MKKNRTAILTILACALLLIGTKSFFDKPGRVTVYQSETIKRSEPKSLPQEADKETQQPQAQSHVDPTSITIDRPLDLIIIDGHIDVNLVAAIPGEETEVYTEAQNELKIVVQEMGESAKLVIRQNENNIDENANRPNVQLRIDDTSSVRLVKLANGAQLKQDDCQIESDNFTLEVEEKAEAKLRILSDTTDIRLKNDAKADLRIEATHLVVDLINSKEVELSGTTKEVFLKMIRSEADITGLAYQSGEVNAKHKSTVELVEKGELKLNIDQTSEVKTSEPEE